MKTHTTIAIGVLAVCAVLALGLGLYFGLGSEEAEDETSVTQIAYVADLTDSIYIHEVDVDGFLKQVRTIPVPIEPGQNASRYPYITFNEHKGMLEIVGDQYKNLRIESPVYTHTLISLDGSTIEFIEKTAYDARTHAALIYVPQFGSIIIGGWYGKAGNETASVIQVNPSEAGYVSISPLQTARYKHSAKYHDGKIWVVAGYNLNTERAWLKTIEVMVPEENSWTYLTPLKHGFFNGNIQFTGSIMYAIGINPNEAGSESSLEVYNIADQTSVYNTNVFTRSNQETISYLTADELVVVGGYNRNGTGACDKEERIRLENAASLAVCYDDPSYPSSISSAALAYVNFEV